MTRPHDLPADLTRAIKEEIRHEDIQYLSQPNPWVVFYRSLPIWLMGIPWSALVFPIFAALIASVFSQSPPDRAVSGWEMTMLAAAITFVSLFVLVGGGMLLMPFWARWKALHTAYVITDERLVVLTTSGRETSIKSVLPVRLRGFERTQNNDGSGSLKVIFGHDKDSAGDWVEHSEILYGIPDVRRAEQLLRELQFGEAG